MFLSTSCWIIPASLQSGNGCPQPAGDETAVQRGSVVPMVSQWVSCGVETWGLTSVLKVLCMLVSTSFIINLPTLMISWFHCCFLSCRSLTQQRQEVVDKVASPWRILETYSYNRYHPMGEVSMDAWWGGGLVVVTTASWWARNSSLLISADQRASKWEVEICLCTEVKGFTNIILWPSPLQIQI